MPRRSKHTQRSHSQPSFLRRNVSKSKARLHSKRGMTVDPVPSNGKLQFAVYEYDSDRVLTLETMRHHAPDEFGVAFSEFVESGCRDEELRQLFKEHRSSFLASDRLVSFAFAFRRTPRMRIVSMCTFRYDPYHMYDDVIREYVQSGDANLPFIYMPEVYIELICSLLPQRGDKRAGVRLLHQLIDYWKRLWTERIDTTKHVDFYDAVRQTSRVHLMSTPAAREFWKKLQFEEYAREGNYYPMRRQLWVS